MKRILPFISITSGRLSANNMALCALRAIDFFSQNVMSRMTQTYVIINRNNRRLILFLQTHVHFATILQVATMNCFWIIVPRAIMRCIYSFCVDAKFDEQSARCVAGTVACRRGSTALTFVSECRWAEHRRKRPSAYSGENRAALSARSVVRVLSNALHG